MEDDSVDDHALLHIPYPPDSGRLSFQLKGGELLE